MPVRVPAAPRSCRPDHRARTGRRGSHEDRAEKEPLAPAGELREVKEQEVAKLLRSLEQAARDATPEVRSEVLRTLVGRAVASWDGDGVRLRVAYAARG